MKVHFYGLTSETEGVRIISNDLDIEIVDSSADITVYVEQVEANSLCVSLSAGVANIRYGGGMSRFFRGVATIFGWIRSGITEKKVQETPTFNLNGAMVDMSRNAVMNVKTVKFMLRKMALMGMNAFMLYTEDTYEIENRPYFGYMRGRYTKEELRELDSYALALGIELIPCIQMLGHLATHLRWSVTSPYRDTVNTMLVGSEETYKLIDDMFKTISATFTSKKLHIGMDETHDLGTGAYLDKNGYRPRGDIYFEHLKKIIDMAKGHGFKPMMWSDMFYQIAAGKSVADYDVNVEITEEFGRLVPKGVQQVFWDYYHEEESFYAINIEKHKNLCENTMFAGGIWTWSGHCPHFSRSLRHTVPALEACKKGGVREVIATIWHNGSECSLILSLAGLAWYADYDYKGCYDERSVKECFENACVGSKYVDFMKTELPELPHGGNVCISRELLYNDPLIGLIDKHIEGIDMRKSYEFINKELAAIDGGAECFASAFEVIKNLSRLLLYKADYGVRLKAAYDNGDRAALSALADECGVIIEKISALRDSHRSSWFEYNKPHGWEVHDIRYGGLIMRFETARMRINDYLSGKISAIEELDTERLYLNGKPNGTPFDNSFLWIPYQKAATASRL